MELVGRVFCDFLLKANHLQEGVDYKIFQKKKGVFEKNYSRVRYKAGGVSDVFLYEDVFEKGGIEYLITASHEASHLINNRKDEKRFKRLIRKQNLFLSFFVLTVAHAIISFPNLFWKPNIVEIPLVILPILIIVNILGMISAFLFAKEYNKDESLAEIKNKKLVNSYLQKALKSVGDSREFQDLEDELGKEFDSRQSGIIFNTNKRRGIGLLLFMTNVVFTIDEIILYAF